MSHNIILQTHPISNKLVYTNFYFSINESVTDSSPLNLDFSYLRRYNFEVGTEIVLFYTSKQHTGVENVVRQVMK